jgi:hypothetical protein
MSPARDIRWHPRKSSKTGHFLVVRRSYRSSAGREGALAAGAHRSTDFAAGKWSIPAGIEPIRHRRRTSCLQASSTTAARQSRASDSPARSGACAASLRDTNSVKSRTALRLACLPLCEKPERPVKVQICARDPHQQGVGISDEARQRRDPETLPYSNDLRRGVRGPEWNLGGPNLTLAGPIRNAMHAYNDPPERIRARPHAMRPVDRGRCRRRRTVPVPSDREDLAAGSCGHRRRLDGRRGRRARSLSD